MVFCWCSAFEIGSAQACSSCKTAFCTPETQAELAVAYEVHVNMPRLSFCSPALLPAICVHTSIKILLLPDLPEKLAHLCT